MNQCDVCTLTYPGEKCPNGWREDRHGDLRERAPGLHQAARLHVERHRAAQEAIRNER